MSVAGGWIEERGRKFVARWRDGEAKRSRTFVSREQAEAYLLSVVQDKRAERYVEPSAVTLGVWIGECCERWADRLTERTIRNYRERARTMIDDRIGRRRLVDVTGMDVQRWVDGLRRDGFAPSTIASAVAVVSSACRDAVVLGVIERNPVSGVRRPGVVRTATQVWDADQVRDVLRMIGDDPVWRVLYVLALSTGMRPGELRALGWQDVDLAAGTIRVARTITRNAAGSEVIGADTKTHRVRSVAIPSHVVEVVRWHRARQRERQLVSASWQDHGLVIDRGDGHWLYQSGWQRYHLLLCLMAGVPFIRAHDLRHSFATLMLEQGVPAKVVAEALGHSSIEITLDRYSHVSVDMQRQASDALGERLFGGG